MDKLPLPLLVCNLVENKEGDHAAFAVTIAKSID